MPEEDSVLVKESSLQDDSTDPELEEVGVREYIKHFFPDIDEEILDAYEYIEQINPELLFPTHSETEELPLKKYTLIHSKIHKEMAEEILKDDWDILIEESGMFGGKTSLSYKVLDKLKEQGYSVGIFIADVMGENFVTARSYLNGERQREAERYGKMLPKIKLPGKETYKRLENGKLRKVNNRKRVVLLDEFSFLDEESVKKFVDECMENHVKVILTGLNRNYLGEELPVFKNLDGIVGKGKKIKKVECKSFIPGIDDNEPSGTHTARYIKLGSREIADFGILPLVVSKEMENKKGKKIVRYTPATEGMTFDCIFRFRGRLREYILHPSDKQKLKQEERLEIQKNR